MNHTQITKAKDVLLVNRYKWLVSRLEKITPVLSAHDNGTAKIENHHHVNKLRKQYDLIHSEMELIEDEMQKRRKEAQKTIEPQPQ